MTKTDDVTEIVHCEPVVPLKRARYWCQSVEYQARRVVATHAVSHDLQGPLRMEEHFLLIATFKAYRWLNRVLEGRDISEDSSHRIKAFIEAARGAFQLRHLREHDDEYDTGGGRDRDSVHTIHESGTERLKVDHQINIIYREHALLGDLNDTTGLHIVLGGRFDVVAAMKAARDLAEHLVALENPGADQSIQSSFTGPCFPGSAAQPADAADRPSAGR